MKAIYNENILEITLDKSKFYYNPFWPSKDGSLMSVDKIVAIVLKNAPCLENITVLSFYLGVNRVELIFKKLKDEYNLNFSDFNDKIINMHIEFLKDYYEKNNY